MRHVEICSFDFCPLSMALMVDDVCITTNFGNWYESATGNTILREGCAFVAPEYEDVIVELGAQRYTRFGESVVMESGFKQYSLYCFDLPTLEKLDPKGVMKPT